jgi:hypothetical protein
MRGRKGGIMTDDKSWLLEPDRRLWAYLDVPSEQMRLPHCPALSPRDKQHVRHKGMTYELYASGLDRTRNYRGTP